MKVYTPGKYAYLRYDLEHLLSQIGELYDIQVVQGALTCEPLMCPPTGTYWASQTSAEHFNALVPRIKSLHMGMYAMLEAIAKQELNKQSVKTAFEYRNPLFTPFRHLNNQFKHFGKQSADINLVLLTHLKGKTDTRIEPMFIVDGRCFPYQQFILMFLNLLEEIGTIQIAGRKPLV